jgi:hypothetical protein
MRATFLIGTLLLMVGCGLHDSHDSWDKYADSVTAVQPTQGDIVGSYLLTQQSINTNGMTVIGGRVCRLDLSSDGSFTVTNYPIWTNSQLEGFISTNGHWRCDIVGSVHDNQSVWGIRFDDTGRDRRMDSLSFTGKAAPYGLLMTYGDPDENAVMIFVKK